MKDNTDTKQIEELKVLAQQNSPSFMLIFHDYFHCFITRLNEVASSSLNHAEIEICAYFKIQFSTKDIALYLKCSLRSVENKKYRIRKKLNLGCDVDFELWMAQF